VVAGADADGVLVHDLGEVVGVDVVDGQRQHAAALGRLRRAVDGEPVADPLGEGPQGVGREADLVGPHRLHADAVEVVDGGVEADGLDDRRGAGLEPGRRGVGREAVEVDGEDHPAAAQERGHGLEQLGPGPQHADAAGADHLVAAEGGEVGAHGHHVGGQVGDVLAGVDAHEGAGGVGGVGDLPHRGEGAEDVRHGGEADELGPVEQPVEVGEVEHVVGADRDPPDLEPLLLLELEPGDDVRVVLHLREQDGVAGTEVGPAPRPGHQVQPLGGVLGEDDLGGARGADEAGHRGPGLLVAGRGPLGEGVDAAVDVGVVGLGELGHGLDHGQRLLGRRRRVEEDQALAVDLLGEDREVAPDGGDVEHVGGGGGVGGAHAVGAPVNSA
jgi:hypothetical protein